MASFKSDRLAEDVKRELTAILRELKDPRIGQMLSIVRVDLSNDLAHCKVYVSSFEGLAVAQQSVEGLRSAEGFIRRELFHRLKMRKAPAMHFVADDSIAHAAQINQKLRDLEG